MKKFKISTVAAIAVYAMLVAGLSSCSSSSEYNDTDQSKFVIKEVLERKGMSKMTTYKVLMLDASGIGEKSFWMIDSIGKYKVGDRLWFQPCH
jgi:hypothetical protein